MSAGSGATKDAAFTPLLEEALAELRKRPALEQDQAAGLLLGFLRSRATEYTLTPEQLAELDAALAEADNCEFVDADEVEALWRRFKR